MAAPSSEFTGKVVLVTGGGAGIGRGVAAAFAARGARLVIAGRSLDAASRAADEIARACGAETFAVRADVAAAADCAALIEAAVRRFGGLDILVNNAAQFAARPLLEVGPQDAARMLATNVEGPLNCAQAMARWAIANGRAGVIVNVSSIAGERQPPGYGLYSASKAALNSLTRSMAIEWAPKGIRVNGIAPGHVDTEAIRADIEKGVLDAAAMLNGVPAGRIAEVEEIADAVLFLCSEKSRHIVGAILTIDGGESLQ